MEIGALMLFVFCLGYILGRFDQTLKPIDFEEAIKDEGLKVNNKMVECKNESLLERILKFRSGKHDT